ncbi:DUF1292 domain-containing protein [uncultured Clostridium sp.]|uniref:DUF1292 domain-containing protein n=1 Tax=uncultured Clostridium sp. TaxID=59620 RepID=UPI002616EA8E|nr:DUF1292 domain-containing protein [uncultured Clostridium sp.]
MEIKDIMSFRDENGNKVDFEVVAKIFLEEKNKDYLLLTSVEDNTDDEMYMFRIDEIDGNEELNLVEDDAEFLEVKKEYKKLLY